MISIYMQQIRSDIYVILFVILVRVVPFHMRDVCIVFGWIPTMPPIMMTRRCLFGVDNEIGISSEHSFTKVLFGYD